MVSEVKLLCTKTHEVQLRGYGRVGVAGNVVTYGAYIHAYSTNQTKPSHHLDAAITTTLLGLTIFPGTTWIGVPAGFIYGGARLVGGEAFDNWFNNQFAPSPVLSPNKIKP